MIQLYEFINKQKTSIQLTDELIESFNRLMNSTYDDCIINESLVFENKGDIISGAYKEFINALISVKDRIRIVLERIKNKQIPDVNISRDYETKYKEFGNEYNSIIEKYFGTVNTKDKSDKTGAKRIDLLSTTNNNELSKEDIKIIIDTLVPHTKALSAQLGTSVINKKEKTEQHIGFKELNALVDKMSEFDNTIEGRIEKSDAKRAAKEAAKKLKEKQKNDDNIKKVVGEYKKISDEWDRKLDELNEWQNGEGAKLYSSEFKIYTITKENYLTKINNGDKKALEYFKNAKDVSINIIKQFIKKQEELQQNIEDADIETTDSETPQYIKTCEETLSKLVNDNIIKTVASSKAVNKDVKEFATHYVNIVKFLCLDGQDEQNKSVGEEIANIKDNNTVIGLQLMLMGAIALNNSTSLLDITKNIAKSIKVKKYDDAFIPKKEETK